MAEVAAVASSTDVPLLRGTDYVELYVGNARQAAHFYRTAFGFDVVAYAGPETGVRDRASYVLEQGRIRLVVTAPLTGTGEIADFVRRHGDSVRAIAWRVDDAIAAFDAAARHGAHVVAPPRTESDDAGVFRYATVGSFGDVVHHLVEREEYGGPHRPGYRAEGRRGGGVGLHHLDHIVGNVEPGQMGRWVEYYRSVFGFASFQEFAENDIATQYSALRSTVTRDPRSSITLPINEPAQGVRPSQIQEYLDYHGGPGIQHLALHTDDIVATVTALRERGVDFLDTPDGYYEALAPRLEAAGVDVDLGWLRPLGILVDLEEGGGVLLQIFTAPVGDRPTLFYEVIERRGALGFGKGNFRALFEAVEREQAARGNL